MKKQIIISAAVALMTALAGCGGASDGGSSSTDNGNNTNPPTTAKAAGPLDAVQDPISNQIIAPLATALAGTPLQGVVNCLNQVVVVDAIDAVDSIAAAIQATDPTALASAATADKVQGQLQNLTVNLQGTLMAMAGHATACSPSGAGAPTGTNPLAGTPLASVGSQLEPVLLQVYNAVTGGASGGGSTTPPDLSMNQLVSLYGQLNSAVQTAFAQVPSQVTTAPVLGGVFTTIRTAMAQANLVVVAGASNNPAAAQTAVATATNIITKAVLLNVIPVSMIETQGGHAGLLSTPIAAAVDQITALLSGLDVTQPASLQTQLQTAVASIVAPEQSDIVAQLIAPLMDALSGVGAPSSDPLGPVTTALHTFLSAGPLAEITTSIEQLVAGGGACPTTGTPLAFLCTLHLGLPL